MAEAESGFPGADVSFGDTEANLDIFAQSSLVAQCGKSPSASLKQPLAARCEVTQGSSQSAHLGAESVLSEVEGRPRPTRGAKLSDFGRILQILGRALLARPDGGVRAYVIRAATLFLQTASNPLEVGWGLLEGGYN